MDHSHPDVPEGQQEPQTQQANTAVLGANVPVDAGKVEPPIAPGVRGGNIAKPKARPPDNTREVSPTVARRESEAPVVTGRTDPPGAPQGGNNLGPVHIDTLRQHIADHAEQLLSARDAQQVGGVQPGIRGSEERPGAPGDLAGSTAAPGAGGGRYFILLEQLMHALI